MWHEAQGYIKNQRTKFYPCCKSCCTAARGNSSSLICAEGQHGVLCDSCRAGYFKSSVNIAGACVPCGKSDTWVTVLLVCLILALAAFCLQKYISRGGSSAKLIIGIRKARAAWEKSCRSKVKLTIGFFQMVFLFGSVYDVQYPGSYLSFLGHFRLLSFDIQFFDMQCVIEHNYRFVVDIVVTVA